MKPNLSVVVTGRNDNYDGNFDDRLALALSKNMNALPLAEFIFVEWNPILTRGLTSKKLKNIFNDRLKCYVVHPKYHSQYCTIDGFLEYPAKNVGIRKSTGDFVVCTNSDIIFTPDVVERVNKRSLRNNIVYRANRVDIKLDHLFVDFPLAQDQILDVHKGATNAAGDFLLMNRNLWLDTTGYCEAFPEQRLHKDAFIAWLLTEVNKYPIELLGHVTHWRHPSSWANGYIRPKVGDTMWDFKTSGFTRNADTWGLTFTKEVIRDGVTWLE